MNIVFLLFLALLTVIAFKSPYSTVVAYIITSILPTVFAFVPGYNEALLDNIFGNNLRIGDIFILAMIIAMILKALHNYSELKANKMGFAGLVLISSLYMLVEIFRKVPEFGINAFGEFRYTYLTLVVPIYVCVFFTRQVSRIKLFRALIAFTLFFALISFPIIGILKGWGFGSFDRFFTSDISLGLFWGALALILSKKYEIIKKNKIFVYTIVFFVILLIFVDGHRSVWMVIVVTMLVLLSTKEIKRAYSWAFIALLILTLAFLVLNNFMDVTGYVATRSLAYFNPEQDDNANWRLMNWEFQLLRFIKSPIVGEGFGAYWGRTSIRGDVGIMPHNIYIMILAKLGLIGIILYLSILLKISFVFKSWLKKNSQNFSSERAIVILAICASFGVLLYGFSYAVEVKYSWIFMGLGLAVLKNKPHITEENSGNQEY